MSLFERYLTLWVALCIVAGIALGHWFPGLFHAIGAAEVAHVNLPVAALIWLMIIPMLVKVDFAAIGKVREHWRGIGVTLFINWAVKPFSMAALGWLFIGYLFRPWLPDGQIDSYIAGLILLAAAPCTAMVFVWSNLSDGEPDFTLTQVALNDTIMVFAFAPIVGLLLGLSAIIVPWQTLLLSVGLYIVVPVVLAQVLRSSVLSRSGPAGLAGTARASAADLPGGAADDPRPVVRLPGPADHRSAADHRPSCGADPHPGLSQLRARLSAEPRHRRSALRGGAIGPDRRQQLLRAGVAAAISLFGFSGRTGKASASFEPVMLSVVKSSDGTRRTAVAAPSDSSIGASKLGLRWLAVAAAVSQLGILVGLRALCSVVGVLDRGTQHDRCRSWRIGQIVIARDGTNTAPRCRGAIAHSVEGLIALRLSTENGSAEPSARTNSLRPGVMVSKVTTPSG